jgi:hypothetical protein
MKRRIECNGASTITNKKIKSDVIDSIFNIPDDIIIGYLSKLILFNTDSAIPWTNLVSFFSSCKKYYSKIKIALQNVINIELQSLEGFNVNYLEIYQKDTKLLSIEQLYYATIRKELEKRLSDKQDVWRAINYDDICYDGYTKPKSIAEACEMIPIISVTRKSNAQGSHGWVYVVDITVKKDFGYWRDDSTGIPQILELTKLKMKILKSYESDDHIKIFKESIIKRIEYLDKHKVNRVGHPVEPDYKLSYAYYKWLKWLMKKVLIV